MEIRDAKDLLNLRWRHLTEKELEEIPRQVIGYVLPHRYCAESHIEVFVKRVIQKISREFELPVEEVSEVVAQENENFYILKKEIFGLKNSLIFMNAEMENLFSYFTVPIMSEVDKVLQEYKRLSQKQQEEFKALI